MTPQPVRTYTEVLGDDESLAIFLRNMAKFDRHFCELMVTGADFTIRLEVHGCDGKLIHCRVNSDGFDRPRNLPANGKPKSKKGAIGENRQLL